MAPKSLPNLPASRLPASLLGIGRNLTYELVRQNRLPHVRLGNRVLVPRLGLEVWLAHQAGIATSEPDVLSLRRQTH